MWNKEDKLEDVKCVIPDRSYARMYAAVVDDCKANGQFNVSTMGNVSNVGLMARKAEEYGSHDKTFEIPADGVVRVRDGDTVVFEHNVSKGDIWRMCQVGGCQAAAECRARAQCGRVRRWLLGSVAPLPLVPSSRPTCFHS